MRTSSTTVPGALHVGALLVGALFLGACGRGGPAVPTPPVWNPVSSAAVVYYDNGGGIQDSLRMVIRDVETLRRVWEQATSRQTTPPPVPAVDFEREMLILVAAGRMTPEDQIQVDSVGVRSVVGTGGDTQEVLTAVVRTMEGCRRFDADAYPLQIIRVRRFSGPVDFLERRGRATTCEDDDQDAA